MVRWQLVAEAIGIPPTVAGALGFASCALAWRSRAPLYAAPPKSTQQSMKQRAAALRGAVVRAGNPALHAPSPLFQVDASKARQAPSGTIMLGIPGHKSSPGGCKLLWLFFVSNDAPDVKGRPDVMAP